MTRKEELKDIFKDVEENQKKLINPLIDEVIFMENEMNTLKKLPFIQVHPENPTKQRPTTAAKLYKECSQSYMNAIRILSSLLKKEEGEEEDPVKNFLKERGYET